MTIKAGQILLPKKIKRAHTQTSFKVNAEMLTLYWEIGNSIIEKQKQNGWGSKVIELLAADKSKNFPWNTGFSVRNLKYMRTFADAYPQYPIVQVPLAQITWYHQIYHRAFVVFLQEQCKSRIRYAGARQTIDNVFSEGELVKDVVVAKFATTTLHGAIKGKTQTQNVEYYNLDVIIPVGYRVKSKQDTQFRIWATNVLRDYLLKGYALNQRINRIENQVENLSEKVNAISLQIQSGGIPNQGVFFDGQVFDAYELASKIIRSTLKSIVLIDNYLEEFH